MKKIYVLLIACGLTAFYFVASSSGVMVKQGKQAFDNIQDGDIIFQSSQSGQCQAIRIATNSKFSHCGIIYTENGKKYVYEAVQPVKSTSLEKWILYGENNAYVVKRLKNASKVLDKATLDKMKRYGDQFNNKDYDLYFEWSDAKIYCSELVWKIYKNGANIELCKLERLKNFNLSHPKVKAILAERYGTKIPLEEEVVAPSQIESSPLLETVADTYK
ncbi:MAG: YiiX family permuted papain-like enzyme [Flavobacterium sp.]